MKPIRTALWHGPTTTTTGSCSRSACRRRRRRRRPACSTTAGVVIATVTVWALTSLIAPTTAFTNLPRVMLPQQRQQQQHHQQYRRQNQQEQHQQRLPRRLPYLHETWSSRMMMMKAKQWMQQRSVCLVSGQDAVSQRHASHPTLQSSSSILASVLPSVPISLRTVWGSTLRYLTALSKLRLRRLITLTALTLFVSCLVVHTVRDVVTTRQRQRMDPTSEWERYATSPRARGQAMAYIIAFQLVPIWIQLAWLRVSMSIKGTQFLSRFVRLNSTPTTTIKTTAPSRRDVAITALQTRAGQIVANGLLRLGPLYIKIGQIVSSRNDLVPVQWQAALERLQDQVPAFVGQRAQNLAYATWPGGQASFDAIFTRVDWTPLAAASLGQVHRAVLRATNETVAVKLQRPNLLEIYNRDFALLTQIARVVDQWFYSSVGSVGGVSQSWTDIFANAREIMYREIDYRAEAQHGMRFAHEFGLTIGGKEAAMVAPKTEQLVPTSVSRDGQVLSSAASWLRAPYVYANLSTAQVLVMEYVPSIKITATDKLEAANVTRADREYLADCLGRSYLRQFCCHKFFNTDPHGGNLGVELLNMNSTISSERVRLVYYDFGQVAELQQNQADGILELIESIVDLDVDRSVESFRQMGVLNENANEAAVRAKIADNYRKGKIKANRRRLSERGYQFRTEATTHNVTNDNEEKISDAQVMQYFNLPAEYAFVGRALTQLDGVGKSLDPDFDFVSASAPYIVEIKGARRYIQDEALKWITNLGNQFWSLVSPSKN